MGFIKFLAENDVSCTEFPRIVRRIRTIAEKYDECPHCKKEIGEKALFLIDKDADIWRHSSENCQGMVRMSEEAEKESLSFWKSFSQSDEINEGAFGTRQDIDQATKAAERLVHDVAKKYNVKAKDIVQALTGKIK